jgi:WD40-like Beta Propeller Repeat
MHRILTTLCLAASLAPANPAAGQAATDIHLLEIAEREGRVLVLGAPARVTDRDGYDNQPAFTADGTALLYTSIRDGQADTYRHDLRTGEASRVTATAESEYSPTPWPGRGGRFSVVRVEADSTQRLWSFEPDGSDPRLVLHDVAPVGYHAWIDPDRLALFVLGDPPTLRLADTRRGFARVVARGIGRSIQAIPGRAAVTFTQAVGEQWWIREYDVERRQIRSVARMQGPDEYHAWTPGGSLLAAHGTGLYQWHDAGTGEWRLVADLAESGLGRVTRVAVSPDGRRLAVVVDRP